MKKELLTLRASRAGIVRLNLASVDRILQLGDNIEFEQPMSLVIFGKDESGAAKIYTVMIESEGTIKVVSSGAIAQALVGCEPSKVFA